MLIIPICRRGVIRTDKSDFNQCRSVGHGLYLWYVNVSIAAQYKLTETGLKDSLGNKSITFVPSTFKSPLNNRGQIIDHDEIGKAIEPLNYTHLGSCEMLVAKIMRNVISHAGNLGTYFSKVEVSVIAVTQEQFNKGLEQHSGMIPDISWFKDYVQANINKFILCPSTDEVGYGSEMKESNRLIMPETYLPILDTMLNTWQDQESK